MKFIIQTYGCQMNQRDSEKLHGMLKEMGCNQADDIHDADIVLLNTCCVRENAENRVFGNLGELKALKRQKKGFIIALCGCMAQQDVVVDKLKKSYPFVDIIFGTFNLARFPDMLRTFLETKAQVIDIWDEHIEIEDNLPTVREFAYKSGLNIMVGCNNFCSYCIVPYVRGRERSRKPDDIQNEAKNLVKDGVKEIMLLGQNVNSYEYGFAKLLDQMAKLDGLSRIRFMTSHPKDCSADLIHVMNEHKNICKHLHLPMQSGSSKVLKSMNRGYTKEHYLNLVLSFKNIMPKLAVSTDIIVGFPGETEEDFEDTLDVVRQVGFANAFTFMYSKRTGTPAAKLENPVPENVAKERFNKLLDTLHPGILRLNEQKVGQTLEVLVEGKNKGRADDNTIVHFDGKEEWIGKLLPVRINTNKTFYLTGEVLT